MADERERALERLAKATLTLVDMRLASRVAYPPVDDTELIRSCLDLMLEAWATESKSLERAPGLPEASKKLFGAVRARLEQLKLATVDANVHLIELSQGWRCPKCQSDVAAAAAASVGPGGKPKVELVCRACKTRSALAPAGQEAFQRLFGHLVAPTWNPAANGFVP